jgi:WD40 repeat protein
MTVRIVLILTCWIASAAVSIAAPPITAAAFTPDGKLVLLGSQDGIEVRSWPELKPDSPLKSDLSHVHDLAFAPDGKTFLAAGGSPAEVGSVEVFDWVTKKRRHRIELGKDLVYKVAWSPDGSRWAAACADGLCRVVVAESGKEEVRYAGHSRAVLAVAFLPDGKTIASAGVDQTVQVWEAKTGKPIRTLDNHVAAVNDLAVRPNGEMETPSTIASVSDDRTVRLWHTTTGRLLRFAKLDSPPRAVVWTNDGSRVVVACADGSLRKLDPDTLELVGEKANLGGRAYTLVPNIDGKSFLLAGESGRVKKVE